MEEIVGLQGKALVTSRERCVNKGGCLHFANLRVREGWGSKTLQTSMMHSWQSKHRDYYTTKTLFSIGFLNQNFFQTALFWKPPILLWVPMPSEAF